MAASCTEVKPTGKLRASLMCHPGSPLPCATALVTVTKPDRLAQQRRAAVHQGRPVETQLGLVILSMGGERLEHPAASYRPPA
jgi:hypothetical protein